MLRDEGALLDIYNAGHEVLSFAGSLTAEEIARDDMRFSAILYKFIIIGEATKRISSELRAAHSDISWVAMAGMRNVLVHQYDNIDVALLERAINVTLPSVLREISAMIPKRP